MSVSENYLREVKEEELDLNYEELVNSALRERKEPVSPEQIKEEVANERRYDNTVDPESVEVENSRSIDQIFEDIRERNDKGELDGDLEVYPHMGRQTAFYSIS